MNFCLESFGSEHSCHNREKNIEEYSRKHSTSKILFFIIYLLEDEQELSLGMLICLQRIYNFWFSMLYYLLFWALLGIIIHFYIIFGTNLLTGGPAQNCCFCLFQCFEEKEYQTESKRNEINWRSYFCKETYRIDLGPTSGDEGGAHEGRGRAHPPGACPPASWPPLRSTDVLLSPIYTHVS